MCAIYNTCWQFFHSDHGILFIRLFLHRDISYASTVHDLKLLLLRFAQEKSFHDDTGGGGPQSNMHIIPYLIHMALYVINTWVQYLVTVLIITSHFLVTDSLKGKNYFYAEHLKLWHWILFLLSLLITHFAPFVA